MFDLIVRNGTVIDGTGRPGYRADIAVADSRIAEIGVIEGEAATEIDAEGLVVAPGFIDIHTHYDAQAFWDPRLTPSSNHGVTTVLAGNCGFSIAPLSGRKEDAEYLQKMLSRVEGMPLESLRPACRGTGLRSASSSTGSRGRWRSTPASWSAIRRSAAR